MCALLAVADNGQGSWCFVQVIVCASLWFAVAVCYFVVFRDSALLVSDAVCCVWSFIHHILRISFVAVVGFR